MSTPPNLNELTEKIRSKLQAYLSDRRDIDESCDWEAFAKCTAVYVLTFQHVLDSRLPESPLFHSYTNNGDPEQLINLGYSSDGQRLGNYARTTKRKRKRAQKKAEKTNSQADRLEHFLEQFAHIGAGRPPVIFNNLNQRCFFCFAQTYEKFTGCEAHAGEDSVFLDYISEVCVKAIKGDLKNIRELAKKSLNTSAQIKPRKRA